MAEITNLKEERFILAHGFSPWPIGSIAFRPGEAAHHGRSTWWSKSAHLIVGQEVKREEESRIPQFSLRAPLTPLT
jgi:hypothetical protein